MLFPLDALPTKQVPPEMGLQGFRASSAQFSGRLAFCEAARARMMASMGSRRRDRQRGHPAEDGRPSLTAGAGPVLAQAAVLVVLVCAMFLGTLRYEFINYDVYDQVIDNPLIRSLGPANLLRIFTSLSTTSYYPIRVLSFAVDYAVWELNPRGYHLTNLLLHLANVLLVYALIRRLCRFAAHAAPGPAPLLGAALFAVHPVVVEPVCWQGAREELLMTFFMLAGVHCHILARRVAAEDLPPAKRRRRLGVGLHVLTAIFCAFSCMSSAMGAATPLVVTACEVVLLGSRRPGRILAGTGALWLIGAATVVGKWLCHAADLAYTGPKISLAQRPLVVLSVYALNLRTIVWPRTLTLLYPHKVPAGFQQPDVLAGAVLILMTLIVLWLIRRNRPALFAALWFILALSPSAQVIPHQHFRADRFLYAPLVGAALAAGLIAAQAWKRPGTRLAGACLAAIVIATLATRTRLQLPVWKDNIALFTHCIAVNPTPLAYNNRGTTYGRMGRNEEAIADFTESLRLQPGVPEIHFNLARACWQAGRREQALTEFRRVAELDPQGRAGELARRVLTATRTPASDHPSTGP